MSQSFESARRLILERVRPLAAETVPLSQAGERMLAEAIDAPWGLPLWDNSAMDGYAVRSGDCGEGSALWVVGYLPAGARAEGVEVGAGEAVKIMTGAPIPQGADAVMPVELAEERGGTLWVAGAVRRGDHIRLQGEDIAAGERIMESGRVLGPTEVSLLASYGLLQVSVFRRPMVAILSTGDELVEPGETLGPGQIVNSNSLALAAAVEALGAEARLLGIARDNAEALEQKITQGVAADMLITSAGISVGDRDFVQEVLDRVGVRPVFSKVDIKPGRPTAFALAGQVPVFSLPGNPVSSLLTFDQFVRPALLRMMGSAQPLKPTVKGVLDDPIRKKPGRTQLLRVVVRREGGSLRVRSAGDQNTGILKTLLNANGVAILPAERTDYGTGEQVDLYMMD